MNVAKLEKAVGHKFGDPDLLTRSVTHRSWAHEKFPVESDEMIRHEQNESLEFVGDSVVGLVIAEELYRRHPSLSEGDLTLMKHHLVSMTTLARIAESLGLGQFIRMGRGEEKTGGRKKPAILADTLEAVIAAIFFDGGYASARAFIVGIFSKDLKKATPQGSLDYKTLLQETLQAGSMPTPTYSLIKTEGMPHARTFLVEASWGGERSIGTGNSIKLAEMMAASEALKSLQKQKVSKRKD
ncbi:MAG: ribonuclease III [Pyrinomonadaceae bacterium]